MKKRHRAAAAVEAALTLPLLITLALVCGDLGRALHAYDVLSNAVRAGAEFGAVHKRVPYATDDWEARLREVIVEEMQSLPHYDDESFELEVAATTDALGLTQIDVTGAYPFETIVDWPGYPHQLTLRHQVVMRQRQ